MIARLRAIYRRRKGFDKIYRISGNSFFYTTTKSSIGSICDRNDWKCWVWTGAEPGRVFKQSAITLISDIFVE